MYNSYPISKKFKDTEITLQFILKYHNDQWATICNQIADVSRQNGIVHYESSSSRDINVRKAISSEISIHRGSNIYIYIAINLIFAPIYIQSISFNYTVSSGKPFTVNKGGKGGVLLNITEAGRGGVLIYVMPIEKGLRSSSRYDDWIELDHQPYILKPYIFVT